MLAAAGVSLYSGWTYPVDGKHADQTDAFLTDRLLGEPSAALAAYVNQRSPLQRPFSLTDVLAAAAVETRSGGLITSSEVYTYSPDVNNPAIFTTTGTGTVTDAIVIPSIASMAVKETLPDSTVTIAGSFTAATGTVMFGTGDTAAPLTVDSWTSTKIVAELPSSGGGTVVVMSPTGLQSPGVPLTYWHGHITYRESATTMYFGNDTGSGTGSLQISLDFGIRSSVAPAVPSVDVSPLPQNLYVSDLTPGSTGTLAAYRGSFTSNNGAQTATVTPSANAITLVPYVTSDFVKLSSDLNPVGGAASCNNAMPGPATSGQANIACPGFSYAAMNAGTCSDNQDGQLCGQADDDGAQLGNPSSQYGDDEDYDNMPSALTLTMDPNTYAISLSATTGTTFSTNYSNFSSAKETMSGNFDAPIAPPQSASRARGPARLRR